MKMGIMDAIKLMGETNEGKSDKETHVMVRKIIKAMTEKKRQEWPTKELRQCVNGMDTLQRKLFLETLLDMNKALDEVYGDLV